MSLSRSDFVNAGDALIAAGNANDPVQRLRGLCGWSWIQSPSLSSLKCLVRTRYVKASHSASKTTQLEEDEDEDDEATVSLSSSNVYYSVREYIVYSSIFSVPAFYFSCHRSDGSPVPLESILQSTLFHKHVLPPTVHNSFSLTLATEDSQDSTTFPLLSQGDHPVLGTPCWYIHPCETASAMSELLKDSGQRAAWLELWLMLIGTIVDLQA